MNGTANGTMAMRPVSGTDTLGTLINSLAVIFFVMLLGYLGSASGFVPRAANKGIGPMVGKICLPLLIFRNVAKLDLSSAPFGVVGCCGIVKITSFLLAAALAFATRKKGTPGGKGGGDNHHAPAPGDLATQLGIYTLFCTGSNDLAMGLAIIESLYPPAATSTDLGALTFVVVGMQVAFFTPLSFVLLELGKAKAAAAKRGATPTNCSIAKVVAINLVRSPIILATFLGLIYTAVNPPDPDDTTVHKNIPALLDAMILKGGSAFGMSALFLGGMAVVGKFKLLRGKALLLPVMLSLVKILVAPIVGFYVTHALYAGSEDQALFSQYVFVYSSLPTAGSIVVFAQAYDVSSKDMISGGSVLVLLLFIPVCVTTATLLVGGQLQGASVSDVGHVISILGGVFLLATAAISPDWRTFPKCGVIQLAVSCVLFSSLHVRCSGSLMFMPAGWGDCADELSGNLTYLFRIWRRALLAYGLGGDLLLLHCKGRSVARKAFPATSVLCAALAIACSVVFATTGERAPSRFPCWYNYGAPQIEFDMWLMIVEGLFVLVVLVTVSSTAPTSRNLVDQNSTTTTAAASPSHQRSNSVTSVASTIIDDGDDEQQRGDGRDSLAAPHKLGVSGGYWYRVRIVLGVHLLSLCITSLSNRTALRAAQGGIIDKDTAVSQTDPLFGFIQILTIVMVDAKAFVICLSFASMRTSGWLRCFRTLKHKYVDLMRTHGGSMGYEAVASDDISLMLRRLASQLVHAKPKLLRNHRHRLHVYRHCVPGSKLLDYLIKKGIAADRHEAELLAKSLFYSGLLHHVT